MHGNSDRLFAHTHDYTRSNLLSFCTMIATQSYFVYYYMADSNGFIYILIPIFRYNMLVGWEGNSTNDVTSFCSFCCPQLIGRRSLDQKYKLRVNRHMRDGRQRYTTRVIVRAEGEDANIHSFGCFLLKQRKE